MSKPDGGRWDDPDYQPTEEELNEPITLEGDPTAEEVAAALMRSARRRHLSKPLLLVVAAAVAVVAAATTVLAQGAQAVHRRSPWPRSP